MWVDGANGFYPSAPLGVTFSGRIRRGVAREPIQNNRVNFNLYVVPLWVIGNRNLHPSAPLGVTFVMRHKSNQKDFSVRRKKESK